MTESSHHITQQIPHPSIIQAATRAPSSHNTQPWLFSTTDRSIELYADRSRALPVNDPHDRELHISCGCAIRNIEIAASALGFETSVDLLPDSNQPNLLASVTLTETQRPPDQKGDLAKVINDRRTHRQSFDDRAVSHRIVDDLKNVAAGEKTRLEFIDGSQDRAVFADLVAQGDKAQWADSRWRDELATWMRTRNAGDGLTVPGLLAPLLRFTVRHVNMGRIVSSRDKKLALDAPILAILLSDRDSPQDWLLTGQALQSVLLRARQNGVQASYLNQPIQVADLRSSLSKALNQSGSPQIALRLGFPQKDLPLTPRRDVESVINK